MTLESLLVGIGKVAINERLVHFAGAGDSLYEINDLTVVDYPVLYVSPTGIHRIYENYTTYALTIFYVDRLTEDSSNSVNIHSTGIEVLKNLLRKLLGVEGIISVEDNYTIQLFTETERLKDRCSGAYATVEITVINDTICEV